MLKRNKKRFRCCRVFCRERIQPRSLLRV